MQTGKKAETCCHHNSFPMPCNWEEIPNFQLLPEEWGVLDYAPNASTFKDATLRMSPQITYLWTQMGLVITSPTGLFFKKLLFNRPASRSAHLPGFPCKGLESILSKLLRVQLLNSLHLGAKRYLPLWDTDGSWHTLNYREAWRTKMAERFQRQPGALARPTDEVHLMTTPALWRLAGHSTETNTENQEPRRNRNMFQKSISRNQSLWNGSKWFTWPRVQSNSYAHSSQESYEQSKNFNQRQRTLRSTKRLLQLLVNSAKWQDTKSIAFRYTNHELCKEKLSKQFHSQ